MNEEYKILIVDDEPSARDTFEALLYKEGCQLLFAEDGVQALESLDIVQPDVILLDVMMPGMNGFEVCRRIKKSDKFKHIPIVMVTALDGREDIINGLDAGADEFLTKPVMGSELRARVRSMLRIKKLYDNLLRTLSLREDLSSMIIHDIRNPLATIYGLAQILSDSVIDDEGTDLLEKLIFQVERMNSMINDMLMLTKMEFGKPILTPKYLEINSLMKSAWKNNEIIARGKKVKLDLQLPDKSIEAKVDGNLFLRMVDNLISNAMKFSSAGCTIRVVVDDLDDSSQSNKAKIRLKVIDEGIGIPPEYRKKIFEKYEVVKVKQRGITQVGIGLAFCKMVAEAHGGTIHVEPNTPKGSIFIVEI